MSSWDQLWNQLSVWRDAYWVGFYTAALAVAGMPTSPRLGALGAALAEVPHWWWPTPGTVVLADRPTVLHLDGDACFSVKSAEVFALDPK
jgi:hypothetical protein